MTLDSQQKVTKEAKARETAPRAVPCSSGLGLRAEAALALIGGTPTVPLRFDAEGVTVHAKCEFLNPGGSVKDRFAACVILDAERRGLLPMNTTVSQNPAPCGVAAHAAFAPSTSTDVGRCLP